jgi:hypothetical protein
LIAAVLSPGGLNSAATFHFGAEYLDLNSVNASCYIIFGGFNQFGLGVADNLTFAPTVHDVYFEIDNVSGSSLTTLAPLAKAPSSRVHMKRGQRVDALHPKLEVHRSR